MFGWKSKTSGKTAGIRSTKSYVYFPDQTLGDGATSSVYLGRNKRTTEKVAVKVFNVTSYQRSSVVQDREFDVLYKLKHENIVRLLAIEDDTGTRQRVLIMELCDCSVLNMLEKPEYYFGFQEDEFLGILQDITAGMKYLQDMDIVHRDIKPGNIMRRLGPDKRPSFKLADFGAARELEEGEQFMSLYGTEEYLHPDMYGRALLRKVPNNPFTAQVDLWSLGVTIYHIATGSLPFRPYGGRKNKKTMHDMTSKKLTGVISAVQKDSMQAPIQYSTELPAKCHLSVGLRLIVTPMLAGLLESNPDRMWSFQSFFTTTQRMFTMKQIHVFEIEKSQLLKIYSDPDFTLAEVQEQIAAQTNIPADQQILAHEGKIFIPESTVKCRSYAEMSERSPVILLKCDKNNNASSGSAPILPSAPAMPTFSSVHSLDGDYTTAKACVAVIMFMAVSQRTYFVINDLHTLVAKTISGIVKSNIVELNYHHAQTNGLRSAIEILHQSKHEEVANILTVLESYLEQCNGNKSDYEGCRENLVSVREEISEQQDKFNLMEMQFQKIDRLLKDLVPYITTENLITTWDPGQGCAKSDRCSDRLDVFREEMQNIFEKFQEDRKLARLASSDEQIHKLAKQNLQEISIQATTLMQHHCANNLKKSHTNFSKWFMGVSEIRAKVKDLDEQLAPHSKQLVEYHVKTKQVAEKWTMAINESVKKLSSLLKKAITPDGGTPFQQSQNQCVKVEDIETDGSFNELLRYGHGSGSSFSNTSDGSERFISVPKSFRKELESMNSESTNDTVRQSRQLLEQFRSLSLTAVSLELSDESDDEFFDIE